MVVTAPDLLPLCLSPAGRRATGPAVMPVTGRGVKSTACFGAPGQGGKQAGKLARAGLLPQFCRLRPTRRARAFSMLANAGAAIYAGRRRHWGAA